MDIFYMYDISGGEDGASVGDGSRGQPGLSTRPKTNRQLCLCFGEA